MRFEKWVLLFNPNFIFLEILLDKSLVFILTFDDSFNWSKQFMVSDNNELPIFKVNGFTFVFSKRLVVFYLEKVETKFLKSLEPIVGSVGFCSSFGLSLIILYYILT